MLVAQSSSGGCDPRPRRHGRFPTNEVSGLPQSRGDVLRRFAIATPLQSFRAMSPSTQVVEFDGRFLQRGFWLYVWEVELPDGTTMLYVGRTGDSSSANAQSPFNRMSQHLGRAVNSSMLRNHLAKRGVEPEDCSFSLTAHGPILPEAPDKDLDEHKVRRDVVAAIEKRLADDLRAADYDVVNTVSSTKALDEAVYLRVHTAFAERFSSLR